MPTKPEGNTPMPQKKTIKQKFHEITQTIDGFRKATLEFKTDAEKSYQANLAMASCNAAFKKEQYLLDVLVRLVQVEMELSANPKLRKLFDKLSDAENDTDSTEEKFISHSEPWRRIIKPAPVADAEIQSKIDTLFSTIISDREKKFSELRERCNNDPIFKHHFSKKMIEENFPFEYALSMVPLLIHHKNYKIHHLTNPNFLAKTDCEGL